MYLVLACGQPVGQVVFCWEYGPLPYKDCTRANISADKIDLFKFYTCILFRNHCIINKVQTLTIMFLERVLLNDKEGKNIFIKLL